MHQLSKLQPVKGWTAIGSRPQFELVKGLSAVHARDVEDGDEKVPRLEEGGQPILRRGPLLLPRPQKLHSSNLVPKRCLG